MLYISLQQFNRDDWYHITMGCIAINIFIVLLPSADVHLIFFKLIEVEWRKYASLSWVIIGSDNGLSPVRRQAIIWTNAGILLIEPLGTNFSEISIGIQRFSFKKMHLNMSSAKWRPFCLALNVLSWAYIILLKFGAWISNYKIHFDMDVITYPCTSQSYVWCCWCPGS